MGGITLAQKKPLDFDSSWWFHPKLVKDLILCRHFNDANIFEKFCVQSNENIELQTSVQGKKNVFSKVHSIVKIRWLMLGLCKFILLNDLLVQYCFNGKILKICNCGIPMYCVTLW